MRKVPGLLLHRGLCIERTASGFLFGGMDVLLRASDPGVFSRGKVFPSTFPRLDSIELYVLLLRQVQLSLLPLFSLVEEV